VNRPTHAARCIHRAGVRRIGAIVPALTVALGTLSAQTPPERRVDGRVVLGTRKGQEPVRDVWVVLHRVGSDTAGALDSARTSARGGYAFRYRPFGDSAAVYFVSASYGGIAYFTPLHKEMVSGDDATITVFDTTSAPIAIHVGGRHVIIGAPQPNGRRPIIEAYELMNDTTVTLVARDSTPLWTANIPRLAERFQLNPGTDISPSAVTHRGEVVGLFAPLSPGLRQFSFTYELPNGAFPWDIRVDRPSGIVELLVQETEARVGGPRLEEVAPVTAEGRTLRRFLAKDVPPGAVFRVDLPALSGGNRANVMFAIGAGLAAMMLAALGIAFARRRPARVEGAAGPTTSIRRSESLLRAIAALDLEYERSSDRSDAARRNYDATRSALKEQLGAALAAERQQA
jgi:hypothetical protein